MRLRKVLGRAGLAAATVVLGAGLATQMLGCAAGDPNGESNEGGRTQRAFPPLPVLDLVAPDRYETAAFAYG